MANLKFDKQIAALLVVDPAELGYDVTTVKDATADYSDEEMHAAVEINLPNYASMVTTAEVVSALSKLLLNSVQQEAHAGA